MHKFLCEHNVFISLGYVLRNAVAESSDNSMFNFLSNCQIFFKAVVPFYIPASNE